MKTICIANVQNVEQELYLGTNFLKDNNKLPCRKVKGIDTLRGMCDFLKHHSYLENRKGQNTKIAIIKQPESLSDFREHFSLNQFTVIEFTTPQLLFFRYLESLVKEFEENKEKRFYSYAECCLLANVGTLAIDKAYVVVDKYSLPDIFSKWVIRYCDTPVMLERIKDFILQTKNLVSESGFNSFYNSIEEEIKLYYGSERLGNFEFNNILTTFYSRVF